jgi:hypothetical protein
MQNGSNTVKCVIYYIKYLLELHKLKENNTNFRSQGKYHKISIPRYLEFYK